MLKKIPLDEINVTKNALFFLLRAPTHHSFIFNSRLLYDLKHIVHLSKTVCGFSIFDSVLFLYETLYFCSTKSMDSLTLKRHNSIQNKIIEKPHTFFLPHL